MSDQQLFVLVSTGQNVANLPPVLERANPGDLVLWVESAFAREKKWAVGARRVLAGYKLEVLPGSIEVHDINAPDEVANACRPAVEAWRGKGVRSVLVANGGLKLTPIGLLRAWDELERRRDDQQGRSGDQYQGAARRRLPRH